MATVAQDFSYFDRSFAKGDELSDDDPVVTLAPQHFEQKAKKAAKPATPR